MNTSMLIQNQLLATKFFVPIAPGTLISRPRLTALLDESLKYPFTLISAPAGFGKTTLLSAWQQALPVGKPQVAWVSLDQEDNEAKLFWTYVLTALKLHQPERFTPLLMHLQSSQPPSLKYILTALVNLLTESAEDFLLILDDYHLITEQEVHTTLGYLVEHLPPQLRIILSTRADPPLPLSQLRARRQMLEVRTNQLRCTPEETTAFFHEVMNIQLPDEMIQKVTTRTEGWLVGLQLLALSKWTNPMTLLEETSGDQHYILDYLTEQVLRQQPQEVQSFLLSTCILERLTASLCDAVMERTGSLQMLAQLERANLFVVSLDSKREWYRYHALFAEALRWRLEQTQSDLVLTLHHRASLWYAQHDQTTQAILHALHAKEWHWAAELIERKHLALTTHTWAANEHEMVSLLHWLEQLPIDILRSRPDLCITSAITLWQIAPHPTLYAWLDMAQAALIASLTAHKHASSPTLTPEELQRQEYLLGSATITRAYLQSYEDGQTALSLCQRALTILSEQSILARSYIAGTQLMAYYTSPANDAAASIQSGLQAISLARATGQATFAIAMMTFTVTYMIGAGRLHEAYRLSQEAIRLGTQSGGHTLPNIGWPSVLQAAILHEWNQLDTARTLAEEGIELQKQTVSMSWLFHLLYGYAVLLHIYLSCGELDAARSALKDFEHLGMRMNRLVYVYARSFFTTIDQVRLWLAGGELDQATHWAEKLGQPERYSDPFAHERDEVARVRILLAQGQPAVALEQLEPVLERAATGQRWGHVIEIRLLQALAYQMHQEETLALDALSEAIRLAEPEGYIRSFVDEGAAMETLLSQLRKRDRKHGATPYLDTLLAALQQESTVHGQAESTQLSDPLSKRELEVLQLLARGASNQEIAEKLVITIDTVKRHVSHIFSKLGVQNRMQATIQAKALKLLGEEL